MTEEIGDRKKGLFTLSILLFLVFTVLRLALSLQERAAVVSRYSAGEVVSGYGVLVADPVQEPGRTRLLVKFSLPDSPVVAVGFPFKIEIPLRFGDRVWVKARIMHLDPCSDHVGLVTLAGLTHLKGWGDGFRFMGVSGVNPLLVGLHRIRVALCQGLVGTFGHETGSLLGALVLGTREHLPYRLRFAFRASGLAHLLAVSGFHVGIVALVIFLILRTLLRAVVCLKPALAVSPLLLPTNLASLATIPLLFLYVLLTGGRASAVRAALMLSLYLVARITGRERPLVTAILASFVLLLCWRPAFIFDLGFLLTYLAVGGIVVILAAYRGLEPWLDFSLFPGSGQPRYAKALLLWLMISIFLPVLLWPFVGLFFHRISLVAPVSNLLLTPLASLVIAGGFLWTLVYGLFSTAFPPLGVPIALGSRLFLKGVYWLGRPGLFPWVPLSLCLLLLAVFLSILLLVYLRERRWGALAPLALFLLIFSLKGTVAGHRGVVALTTGSSPVLLCRTVQGSYLVVPPLSPYLFDRCVVPGLMVRDEVEVDTVVLTSASKRARAVLHSLKGLCPGQVVVPVALYGRAGSVLSGIKTRPLLSRETLGCFSLDPGESKIHVTLLNEGG